jgi:hypothetical protein
MKKQEIEHRMECLTAEVDALRLLLKEPEPRTPEAGDVWKYSDGVEHWIIGTEGIDTRLSDGLTTEEKDEEDDTDAYTYLGKFDEVYVRRDGHVSISDVRDALSIKDCDGESVLDNTVRKNSYGINDSTEALAKLGIIAD